MRYTQINPSSTIFILFSAGLVMLMTPGLALFYGGMVRRKNVLNTLMLSLICLLVVSVQWILYGYSLSFGPDIGGIIGNLKWVGLRGVGMQPNTNYAPDVPHLAFMVFQMMFAVITPALIAGAIVERTNFSAFLLFVLLWSTLVYDPVAHWVWGKGGWLHKIHILDFAGGLVVHLTSGSSAFSAALLIGKRKDYGKEPLTPHNIPLTILGTALLWFGWFGFNAGSSLSAGNLSALAFVNTHISASAAGLTYLLMEWIKRGKPTTLGAATGIVAGLVAITPACGFVAPFSALLIGLIAGVLSYYAISLKPRFGYDDSLDVVGVHGANGMWGALATGLFAEASLNPGGTNGLFFGQPLVFLYQLLSIFVVGTYSFLITFLILKLTGKFVPLRVSNFDEEVGLDISSHGENSYYL